MTEARNSGTSARLLRLLSLLQVRRDWPGGALAERLAVSPRTVRRDVDRLRELGAKPLRREGTDEGRWVLLDFAEIVVHVQHQEERVFYALERLWKDCPVIPFVDRDVERAAGRSQVAL